MYRWRDVLLLHWISALLPWIFGGLQANLWEMQPQMPIVVTVAIKCSSTSIGDIAQLDLTFSQRIKVFPRSKKRRIKVLSFKEYYGVIILNLEVQEPAGPTMCTVKDAFL